MLLQYLIGVSSVIGASSKFLDKDDGVTNEIANDESCTMEANGESVLDLDANCDSDLDLEKHGDSDIDVDDLEFTEIITHSEYQKALASAQKGELKTAIPILRRAARAFQNEDVWANLCAGLLTEGNLNKVEKAAKLYDEAETCCEKALALNPNSEVSKTNLKGIEWSRKVRDIPPKNLESESWYVKRSELRTGTGPWNVTDLKFRHYNSSIVNPYTVLLCMGEVYTEENFFSYMELFKLSKVMQRALGHVDHSDNTVDKSMLARNLKGRDRRFIVSLRDRILNRTNSLLGIDMPLFSFYRGVAAHQTVLTRHSAPWVQDAQHSNEIASRCLAAVVVVNDDFEGGDLNLHTTTTNKPKDQKTSNFPKIGSVKAKAGRLFIFLSQTIHTVSPIKTGHRDSFFVWMTCNPDEAEKLEM